MPDKVLAAIEHSVRPTTLIRSASLDNVLGAQILVVSETFQYTGSFKFRAAFNAARQISAKLLLTASSGNFGQALAYACKLLGKSCIVVMPHNSARVKIDAVKQWGGTVELIETQLKSRAQRLQELAAQYPDAEVVSAYDDPRIIEGNASLGEELAKVSHEFEEVIVPIGGGGLSSGVITGLRRNHCEHAVFGVEPAIANDAAQSLAEGKIVRLEAEPQTIADGVRTLSIGQHNWEVLKTGLAGILVVPEDAITEALKLLFMKANLKVEPTGALSTAAVIAHPDRFAGKKVACIVSGGNVDPALFRELIESC